MSHVKALQLVKNFVHGKAFTEGVGPNIAMIAGYSALAVAVGPDLVEQTTSLTNDHLTRLLSPTHLQALVGSKSHSDPFFLAKAGAFAASLSGIGIHTTFAILAANRQALVPPVLEPQTTGTSD